MTVSRTPLTEWTVEGSGPAVPEAISGIRVTASVPGCVHTDLLAAGLIPDPYLGENEKTQSWIGVSDWAYRTELRWHADGSTRQELLFEGVDTVASIRLNGVELLATRNMHRSYRVDVTGVIIEGANQLEVAISSPIKAADAASLELGSRPHTNHHPYNAIRKMACSFGWDWGIDTSTSALWKPVTLETWSDARFAELRVAGDLVDGVPRLHVVAVVAFVDATRGAEVEPHTEVQVELDGAVVRAPVVDGVADLELLLPDAALWWPRGYGEARVHDARITLFRDGLAVEQAARRVGFRSVQIRTEVDGSGTGFALIVNGTLIRIRGANWIPDDAFLHRVDRARYARRLAQAEFANINLLRVWGGGIYESDDFYDECDARGILTWQDFLLACAAYAEEEPLWSEFEAEAREAIVRLAAHPSLVVFNGGNENLWGRQDWGWEGRLDGRTWGAGYYYELFPALVAELAPHVSYTPGSPYTPDRDAPQNDPDRGTAHLWDLWNEKDWLHYRDHRPRFVSEFGWQGPPTWSALTRAVSDDPLTPESPGMLVHQKAIKGNDKLTDGLVRHFPLPNEMADWHWAMSLNQAIAIRTAIEWFRSLGARCTGTIVWQLNDCWPVTSWSAVDGDGRAKPLLHALRHAHADRLLTMQPEGSSVKVAVVNDSPEEWIGVLEVERIDYEGAVLGRESLSVRVPAGTSTDILVSEALTVTADRGGELLVARLDGLVAHWFFAECRDSALRSASCTSVATARPGGWDVEVTAQTLIRELTLNADRLDPDARVDRGLVTLLPGESVVFRVDGAASARASDFEAPTVLRSANDLVPRG